MARAQFRFASSRSWLHCAVTRIVAAILVLSSADVLAQRSYFRLYDQDYGLDVGEIVALAQDGHGFLWIGSHRGLVRFDGRSFVLWGQDEVDEVVAQIIYGAADELLIRTATGRALRRTARGLEPIPGPDGKALLAVDSLTLDADGNLWIAARSQLWRRSTGNDWLQIDRGIPADEKSLRVFADGSGVVVLTNLAAWRLYGSDPAQRLMAQKDLWFAASSPDGSVWLATHYGTGLWRVDAGGTHALERLGGRAMDMRERGGTLWLSLDKALLAYAADGSVRKLGVTEGLPSGGPLFVDRENSLWLGTFVGLMQFPEPDTWQWGEAEGLPSAHTYSVAEYQGIVFASTWSGLAYLNPADGRHFVFDASGANASGAIFAGICALEGHGVWAFNRDHLLQWRDGSFAVVGTRTEAELLDSCAADANGTVWIATTTRLLRLPAGETSPHEVATAPQGVVDEIWLDAGGDLRVLDDESICRLRTSGDSASREDCRQIGSLIVPNSIASVAPDRTWVAANNGIFEFDGERIRRLPGNHLPLLAVRGLRGSLSAIRGLRDTRAPAQRTWAPARRLQDRLGSARDTRTVARPAWKFRDSGTRKCARRSVDRRQPRHLAHSNGGARGAATGATDRARARECRRDPKAYGRGDRTVAGCAPPRVGVRRAEFPRPHVAAFSFAACRPRRVVGTLAFGGAAVRRARAWNLPGGNGGQSRR
jgi:ligand-binding sensor domain-containing protein